MAYRPKKSMFYKPRKKPVAPATPQKKKWVAFPIIWKGFKLLCMSLGFMVLMSAIFGAVFSSLILKQQELQMPE